MLNAWATQYFYFKEQDVLLGVIDCAAEKLCLKESQYRIEKHLNALLDQLLTPTYDRRVEKSRDLNETRIYGESLKLFLDICGKETGFLKDKVTKITGIKGQGGLKNPQFPTGEELEVLRVRIIGTVVSDCQVRGSKGLVYFESSEDRIDRFQKTLSHFGDIVLKRNFRKEKGVDDIYINSAISEAVIFWGIPEGDRTILNYGLPPDTHEWSRESKRALIQDMISQEGCVSENGEISWNRRHALCAGNKSERYGFQSRISFESLDLLRAD
jgi:hypothetical protein